MYAGHDGWILIASVTRGSSGSPGRGPLLAFASALVDGGASSSRLAAEARRTAVTDCGFMGADLVMSLCLLPASNLRRCLHKGWHQMVGR